MRSVDPDRRKLAFRIIVYVEAIRYSFAELIAGHWGRRGFTFDSYLANRILERKYRGARQRILVSYLLHRSLRSGDTHALDIVVARHSTDIPLELMRWHEVEELGRIAALRHESEYKAVVRRVDDEMQRRKGAA